jgi:hypothetical protein
MGRRNLIEDWRRGQKIGFHIRDVAKELERLGFRVEQGSKHWKATHPVLATHPEPGMRTLTINAHTRGKQGEVHAGAISDIVKAVKWIEEQ